MPRIWQEQVINDQDKVYVECICNCCSGLYSGQIDGDPESFGPLDGLDVLAKIGWSFIEGRILCDACAEARMRALSLYDHELGF